MTTAPDSKDSLRSIVAEAISRWKQGDPPDALAVLSDYPEVRNHKSLVLDLAYSEYRIRSTAGESIPASTFCDRFPYRKSLHRILEIHGYVELNPDLLGSSERPDRLEEGEDFLDFVIGEKLGDGAFARVVLAREPALGDRIVVLKVAKHGAEEADTLGKLSHPNIVPVFSLGEDPDTGMTAVCMPFLGTSTLCDVLDVAFDTGEPRKRADTILEAACVVRTDTAVEEPAEAPDAVLVRGRYVDGVVHLGLQLAEALAYTHSKGILHRDLKPSNVLLTPTGKPMLLDFNLSSKAETVAARVGGTLPYMPPEQLRAAFLSTPDCEVLEADFRSDVYSLGVILYELLAGSLPFREPPEEASAPVAADYLLERQLEGPDSLCEKNDQVDEALAGIVERCLEVSPDKRPQSAEELAESLRRWRSRRSRMRRWLQRRRKVVLIAATALLVLAWVFAGILLTRPPYSVRELNKGKAEFREGNCRAALVHFNNCLKDDPRSVEAAFYRGQIHVRMGDWRSATGDFRVAAERSPSGVIRAWLAYCLTKGRYHQEARCWYEEAISAWHGTPRVFNNWGYSYLKTGQLDEARECFNRAIEIDPSLQAPFQNRARITLLQIGNGGSASAESGLTDAERAIQIGPPNWEVFFDAAQLAALARTDEDSDWKRKVVDYLGKSIEHGLQPSQVFSAPPLDAYKDDPAFRSLLTRRPAVKSPVSAVRLVRPQPNLLADNVPAL